MEPKLVPKARFGTTLFRYFGAGAPFGVSLARFGSLFGTIFSRFLTDVLISLDFSCKIYLLGTLSRKGPADLFSHYTDRKKSNFPRPGAGMLPEAT